MSQAVAVLDVGKTNVTLTLFNKGRLLLGKVGVQRHFGGTTLSA